MTIQVEFWQMLVWLAGLLLAFLGASFGAGKLLLAQVERRLDERFDTQERTRRENSEHWDQRFQTLERAAREEASQWARVERDLLTLKADLPVLYVRREDYVRNQTVIEAKLDAVALKIENLQLKGMKS